MAEKSNRRWAIVVLLVLLIAIALLLPRCLPKKPSAPAPPNPPPATAPAARATTSAEAPATTEPSEILSPATLTAPSQVTAGATFAVAWTGPDNHDDFVTIVAPDAEPQAYASYRLTREGETLELTAPIEPGPYQVRYVTGRSHAVLARAAVEVVAAGATIDAQNEVVLGSLFAISWTGPNNKGDFLTIVAPDARDGDYGSYVDADRGSPQSLTAPTTIGEAELRYVTGQGKKVLARRPIKVITATVTLDAPAEAVAGSNIQVTWTGPNNSGDYLTIVPADATDGQYGNYTHTASGSPLVVLTPITPGAAEVRYMTGQGGKVLARRAITIIAAKITLSAPAEGAADTQVSVEWTGPNNPGDYITIVAKGAADGQYGDYINTSQGSPLTLRLPKLPGDAEVRYMSGQGGKVLARIAIKVTS